MIKRVLVNSCIFSALGLVGVDNSGTVANHDGPSGNDVEITWLGHSMFLLKDGYGNKLVTDPYSLRTGYKPPKVFADIITVSHYHHDHDNVSAVDGSPTVVDSACGINSGHIVVEGIDSYHDEVRGDKRGNNIVFKIKLGRLLIAHMGDFGQPITEEQVRKLQGTDVLLIPVGGNFTIDSKQAAGIIQHIKPKIVIPMHFKTEDCNIDIAPVERFINIMPVVKYKGSSVRLSASTLPEETEVWVMDYIQ